MLGFHHTYLERSAHQFAWMFLGIFVALEYDPKPTTAKFTPALLYRHAKLMVAHHLYLMETYI